MSEIKIPFSKETVSIGVSFDVPKEKETIIIGSPEDVKRYFLSGVSGDNIDIRTRKLGTLIDEMNKLAQSADGDKMAKLIAASNGLCEVLNSGKGSSLAAEFKDTLSDMYDNSQNANMLFNYIIFFILTNFNLNHKALNKKISFFCFRNAKCGKEVCGAV
ncbi:MAG: hypothetical protein J1F11_07770 [Oscillospiraceae bacterium]|nr:hypothetical protein [Oscillospiraceae bacterium]